MIATDPPQVGLREWIALPELGLTEVRAKIDTGARTSALHASHIEEFIQQDERWVRFHAGFSKVPAVAKVVACKKIKSSNGQVQERYVISTLLRLGSYQAPAQFTLTCRKSMRHSVLLGCRALTEGKWLVNPAAQYLQPKPMLGAL